MKPLEQVWRGPWRNALMAVAVIALLVGALVPLHAVLADGSTASDGPGAGAYFDLARKDCLGTAQNTTSKVWYTVANGMLSDVYYPTTDNTNVKTLSYIVTDGSSYTDIQGRDTTYTVSNPDGQSLDCRVTTTAKSGKYQIVTDYLTDPAHNTVVMHLHFEALVGDLSQYHLYVRYNPMLNGNGGGGSVNVGGDTGTVDSSTGHAIPVAYDTNTTTNATNRDYGVPVYSALDASTPFSSIATGFDGAASDGQTQLDASHHLTTLDSDATNGNITQTGELPLTNGGQFTLALGFGTSQAGAVSAAEGSLGAQWNDLQHQYDTGWHTYDAGLKAPPTHFTGVTGNVWNALVDQYYYSANVLKASEDKTFAGAISAGLASPWGQAVSASIASDSYFGSYREVFARDQYEAWTGFYTDGDLATARDAVLFLFDKQQLPDGSMPRNSLLNGKPAPDTGGLQLDEVSYPILMADQMGMTDATLYQKHVKPGANFLISHGPSDGVERWEEQTGYSPSTIAAEIAGLVAAADLADANGDTQSAQVYRAVADQYQRSIKGWDVTTNGPLADHPYFIRLSKDGNPNAGTQYNVGNGGPTLDQRSVIDAGFLELVRLGELPANDTDITQSLPVVDATIAKNTPSGTGYLRYNGDGYGDNSQTGAPWATTGTGTGQVWPALTEERGEYDLAAGNTSAATSLLTAMHNFASGVGLIPEQDWDGANLAASPYGSDPTTASIGFVDGQAAGSAAPLTWSNGAYVRLMLDLTSGKLLEQPASVANRYVAHTQGQTTLTVSAPDDQATISTNTVTVTGTTAPGNTVTVAATNTSANSATTTASTTADGTGAYSVDVPVSGGTSVLNITATSASGATADVERTISALGTKVFDVTDPTGDDNGPGNYGYPTASDFHAGAFDLTDFQVYVDSNSKTVTFRVQTANLDSTFGNALGAQMIDLYVHNPNATSTSTYSATYVTNYRIADSAAWSRLLEVNGFEQRYVDANFNSVGSISFNANQATRYVTFSVSEASLGGEPTSGWGFTLAMWGQDGFSSGQDRQITYTPTGYTFGECAYYNPSNQLCDQDPNSIPKVMDTITPSGVSQSDELNYLIHNPVTLQDVVIP